SVSDLATQLLEENLGFEQQLSALLIAFSALLCFSFFCLTSKRCRFAFACSWAAPVRPQPEPWRAYGLASTSSPKHNFIMAAQLSTRNFFISVRNTFHISRRDSPKATYCW